MPPCAVHSNGNEREPPLVKFEVVPSKSGKNQQHVCPFGNERVSFELTPGSCVCLAGNSGAGKTTLATFLAGLSTKSDLKRLDIDVVECDWDSSIPVGERCGVLFQQTALLDALTVAGNISVALEACKNSTCSEQKIKQLIETVGLDYARDAHKYPTQLSGGMARRASLAMQLAQRKRVVILDEPFTGLDQEASSSVAKELVHLRREHGTAFLLISHEPDIAALVMDPTKTTNNFTVTLEPPLHAMKNCSDGDGKLKKPNMFGTKLRERFLQDLGDYFFLSLPLILLAFFATGLAISMLTCDILSRIDVTDKVVQIVDQEVRPMLKLLTGEEAGPVTMMMVKMKVRGMINTTMPQAKSSLYAIGMAKLFVLEIGPLLTALLLCGRIGGSYAGKVATMQATYQNKLLRTLGINPQIWTLLPAIGAALIACPLLTIIGTSLALFLGSITGEKYAIGDFETYIKEMKSSILPPLRLVGIEEWWDHANDGKPSNSLTMIELMARVNFRCTFSDSFWDAIIEVVTYPPFFLLVKSCTFIFVILIISETVARLRPNLSARNVPNIITFSVVMSSLLVIIFDWGFSQLWLLRK